MAENLLDHKGEAARPNAVWVADITDIPTAEDWFYLAGVKDIFSC